METTTIRIKKETKNELMELKGQNLSYDKMIKYLMDFFLTKK